MVRAIGAAGAHVVEGLKWKKENKEGKKESKSVEYSKETWSVDSVKAPEEFCVCVYDDSVLHETNKWCEE